MNFYEKLKQICNERKTTIYALEKKIGLSKGSMIKWQTSSPSADKLQKLADYFNVSVDYLLGRTECPTALKRVPAEPLDDDTNRLLQSFDKLSPTNKQRLLAYIDGLTDAK